MQNYSQGSKIIPHDGVHVILDLYFKKFPAQLNSVSFCRKLFTKSLEEGKFKIIQYGFHKFKPWGLTGFFLLSESHLSFHTWPEKNYIALDLFTCGDPKEAQKTIEYSLIAIKKISPVEIKEQRLKRGYVFQQQ